MTNKSSDTVRIWKEDCSWGYSSLSFIFKYSNGKVYNAFHSGRGWDSNFPRTHKIPPQGSYIFHVNFADEFWKNAPKPVINYNKPRDLNLKIKAIYEIKADTLKKV
jgi:hypothetical protein